MSRDDAMRARGEFLESLNAGRFVTRSNIRLREVVARYRAIRMPMLEGETAKQYESQIKCHLLPAFGDCRLSEITKQEVEALLASKSSLAWATRRSIRKVLSCIFSAAKEWKIFEDDNPAAGARLGKKTGSREKRKLKVEDLRAVLAAVDPECRFLVLILFGCGLSISEALGLKWADLDFEHSTLSIRRGWRRGYVKETTKSVARGRVIRLAPAMLLEFQQRLSGKRGEFLFIGDDGVNPPDDRDMLRYRFRPVVKRLGLYYLGFGWHAFRRQSITYRQEIGGATPLEAQKAAGHSSLDMTLLYTLTDPERETLQQQRMFEHLMGTVEGKPQ